MRILHAGYSFDTKGSVLAALYKRYLQSEESSDLADISQGFEGEDILRFWVDISGAFRAETPFTYPFLSFLEP